MPEENNPTEKSTASADATVAPGAPPPRPHAEARTRRRITSLGDLTTATLSYRTVSLSIDGSVFDIELRSLNEVEAALVNGIASSAIPPIVARKPDPAGKGDPARTRMDEFEFDISNPEFKAKLRAASRSARAIAIFFAVPAIRQAVVAAASKSMDADYPGIEAAVSRLDAGGLRVAPETWDFVTNFIGVSITDAVAESLFHQIVRQNVEEAVDEATGFFSPARSLGS